MGLRVNSDSSARKSSSRYLVFVPVLISGAIFLFHLSVIYRNAVNLPYFDDWEAFHGDNHPASIDAAWLLAFHNEHRMATLKLLIWAQFQMNGWNIRTHLLISFVIYGICVGLLAWVCWRWTSAPSWLMPSFAPFFLTPLSWFNHFMAYTTSVHIWLLLFVIGAYLMFAEKQRWPELLIGGTACILSIYSWAAGFVTALILLLTFSSFKTLRLKRAKGRDRRRELIQLLVSSLMIGLSLLAWLSGYHQPTYHPPLVSPNHAAFWSFFANVVASGFGILRISTIIGVACVLLITTPLCGITWRKRSKMSAFEWAVLASILALLGNQCAVAMGRAGFGIADSKNVEYTEIGIPLLMLSVTSWYLLLATRKRLQAAVLLLLWLLFFMAFRQKWDDFGIYHYWHDDRLTSLHCVQDYYAGLNDGHCPTTYPRERSIAPFLEQGKRLNASFYQAATAKEK